ncbi:MAG TPA: Gfo/Idh/MocA family oxidoreductase [Spirochaetia bacterium]|nr:Gfo/Idh/MocA family oxidoreductase [Spirochaetia bacterium]
MEVKQRAVVVGLGSIGRRHARLLNERPDIRVELCEPDEERLMRAVGELGRLPVHRDFSRALATEPEIVVIATPHRMHAEQTVAALNAGVHVLCEKPMSDNLEDASRMVSAARGTDTVLNIGFHLHFHPGLRRLKELVEGGHLGEIVHFHCRVGSYITLVNSISRYQADLEGALLLDYAHQPDLLYWILGRKPTGVSMTAVRGGKPDLTSNPNALALTCDYDTGIMATVHLNYVQMPERHEYEIAGDRAWAMWDLNTGILRVGRRSDSSVVEETTSVERDPVYREEHQAFLDAVDGKRKPESPAEEAIVSLEIIEAALKSWREVRRCVL